MTIRNLDVLFAPRSVAVIGASRRPLRVGTVVTDNLVKSGFAGPIMPVNPKYQAVSGILAYPDVDHLPIPPDLAVIATPPATVPAVIDQLGRRGTRAAVVLTAGLGSTRLENGATADQAMLAAAKPHLLRILGPNCVGMVLPQVGLNASFAPFGAAPGPLAFVSQSGALCASVLDWAQVHGVGFSHVISLGDALDVDFGDVIDWLGADPRTRAILLYVESVRDARKFLSAARAASRNKPVVAIKSGRAAEGARAAASHTGALAGTDDVYDYALRRAGILRVDEMDELFDSVETLTRAGTTRGNRLAIVTNGGGFGVMATDSLIAGGGKLAELSNETMQELDALLPPTWSHANPVDVIGDAPPERLARAVEILTHDPGVDALLVLYAPTAVAPSDDVVRAVAKAAKSAPRPVLTSWVGGLIARRARTILTEAGLATYLTPGDAVRAFLHLARHRRNQELLAQTPPSTPEVELATGDARAVVDEVLASQRDWLTEPEAKRVLAAYGIPTVETRIARDPGHAAALAREIGFPVALKILSPDVLHKSDVGGVVLDLPDAGAVERVGQAMLARLHDIHPEARLEGFTVQQMARRPGAVEVMIGASVDPVFGPFMLFGRGGIAVEVINDKAVALPPLDPQLARETMMRTRVWRLLQGYRNRPPADVDALATVLVRLSQILIDLPEVVEVDVNPVLADEKGALALDARIRVVPAKGTGTARLAIRPYPRDLEETVRLRDGRSVVLRPIRPDDEPAHQHLFDRLTTDDVRFRFFGQVRALAHSEMTRYTQIDYDREMAFVAVPPEPTPPDRTLGVVRAITDPDNDVAEFAIVVGPDKRLGLGRALLEKMARYCKERGTRVLVGRVLKDNRPMLELAKDLGFAMHPVPDGEDVEVRLRLS